MSEVNVNVLSEVIIDPQFHFDMEGVIGLTQSDLETHLNNVSNVSNVPNTAAPNDANTNDADDADELLETVTVSDTSEAVEEEMLLQACETHERAPQKKKCQRHWPIFYFGNTSHVNQSTAPTTASAQSPPAAPCTSIQTASALLPPAAPSTSVQTASAQSPPAAPSTSFQTASAQLPPASPTLSTTTAPWLNVYQESLESELKKFKLLNEELEHLSKIRETYQEFMDAKELCQNLKKQLNSAEDRARHFSEKLKRLKRVAELKYKRQF